MKRFLAVTLVVLSSIASALPAPVEQPIRRAGLEVIEATGTYPRPLELTQFGVLTQDELKATRFELKEDLALRCTKAPCPRTRASFQVIHTETDGSGVVYYRAEEVYSDSSQTDDWIPRQLTLTDYSAIAPRTLLRHVWLVTLTNGLENRGIKVGGNPLPVADTLSARLWP